MTTLSGIITPTNLALLAANTFTGAQEWATGTAIASAATVNLNTATGNRVHITGTTTITAVTLTRGPRTVIFDGILTLTHNATTNNLPGAVNITTAAGDRAIYESDGTTVYCRYTRANGTAIINPVATSTTAGLVPAPPNNTTTFLRGDGTFAAPAGGITLSTPVASTSGTAINYTGIPAGTKQITIMFSLVSTSGTAYTVVQIGSSSGIESSGYKGSAAALINPNTIGTNDNVSSFVINSISATRLLTGTMVLSLENSSTFTWVASSVVSDENNARVFAMGGNKSLTAVLDRVRITTGNGTDTFDAGEINITYT